MEIIRKIGLSSFSINWLWAFILGATMAWLASCKSTHINNDGILYLQVAQVYFHSGLKAAMAIYPWPFYSMLIAWTHKVTALSFLHSAYLINIVLYGSIAAVFTRLLRQLNATQWIVIFGTLLLVFDPTLNVFRVFLIRGPGYWFFYLLSLSLLLSYIEMPRWWHAPLWFLSLLIGGLFRVEAFIFMPLIPLALLLCKTPQGYSKLGLCLRFYMFPLFAMILMLFIWWGMGGASDKDFGRFQQIIWQFQHGYTALLASVRQASLTISEHVLSIFEKRHGLLFFVGGVIAFLLYYLIITLNFLNIVLISIAQIKGSMKAGYNKFLICYSYILTNAMVLTVFMLQHLFTGKRFYVPLLLVALLFSPFSLPQLWQWYKTSSVLWQRALAPLVFLILIVFIIMDILYYL